MKNNIAKVLFMVALATCLCFGMVSSLDYYTTNYSDSVFRIKLKHNEHRSSMDAEIFSFSSNLDSYAQKHSEKMLAWRSLYHSNLSYKAKYKGENIAYSSIDDPELVFNKWINSSGHRSNIEFMTYKKIGVGKAGNEKRGYYYCVVFSD